MPDQLFRHLWIAAIIVRFIAIVVGVRWRAPLPWISWTIVFEFTEVALFACDRFHWIGPHGWFVRIFVIQQFALPVLLAVFAYRYCKPRWDRMQLAFVVATIIIDACWIACRYPDSPVEVTVWGSAWCSLAILLCLFERIDLVTMTLAAYLGLSATLMIDVQGEWMSLNAVNRATEVLEIIAFSAFSVIFMRPRYLR